MMGMVYFVGAGPGDPGLITRRGEELLRRADCLIYDRLVGKELLKIARPGCEKIDVGKETVPLKETASRKEEQGAINRLLVEKARRRQVVVRLKGGDPTLFGRISEELEALVKAGIRFEIVPGVSSVWAAAAAAGIPLTDRRYSSSVAVVTGQQAAGKRSSVRWESLARGADTLVILMGRATLPRIARRLLSGGRGSATPVALIRWASTSDEEILFSTLGLVEKELQARPDFGPPVVAIVGEVVRMSRRFRPSRAPRQGRGRRRKCGERGSASRRPSRWPQPLKGKKILVTRPITDSAGLAQRLQQWGGRCVALPTIAIRPARVSRAQAQALVNMPPRYDWILFTSHHGVEILDRLFRRIGGPLSNRVRGKVCAIGPRTAQAARSAGLTVDLVPEVFSTVGIEKAFRRIRLKGKRIFIPRSNLGRADALAEGLRRQGAVVEEQRLYETVIPRFSGAQVRRAIRGIDAITFTSGSTVRGFVQALKEAHLPVRAALNGAKVIAIGPETARALRAAGIRRFHLPWRNAGTIEGLVEAVVEAVRPARPGDVPNGRAGELVPAGGGSASGGEGRIGHSSTGSP